MWEKHWCRFFQSFLSLRFRQPSVCTELGRKGKVPPFHGECFWGNFVPYVFMYTLICLACQTSGLSQYFEDTGCLYCWKVFCRLHSLTAVELMKDSFYYNLQGIVGTVLILMKTDSVSGTYNIFFNR